MPVRVVEFRLSLIGLDPALDPVPIPEGLRVVHRVRDSFEIVQEGQEFTAIREGRAAALARRLLAAERPEKEVAVAIRATIQIEFPRPEMARSLFAIVREHFPDGEYRARDGSGSGDPSSACFEFFWRGWEVDLALVRAAAGHCRADGRLTRNSTPSSIAVTAIRGVEETLESWFQELRRRGFNP